MSTALQRDRERREAEQLARLSAPPRGPRFVQLLTLTPPSLAYVAVDKIVSLHDLGTRTVHGVEGRREVPVTVVNLGEAEHALEVPWPISQVLEAIHDA